MFALSLVLPSTSFGARVASRKAPANALLLRPTLEMLRQEFAVLNGTEEIAAWRIFDPSGNPLNGANGASCLAPDSGQFDSIDVACRNRY